MERVCQACGKHNGFAKKDPTDRRSATMRGTIKPNQRSRIIQRAKTRCECCGRPAAATGIGLHVGHVVSIDAGSKAGVSMNVLNSDENLIAECEECNLGHGRAPLPMAVFIAILMTRNVSA
jgi:5-methylcytosine-specific restriction endonuclease McrA